MRETKKFLQQMLSAASGQISSKRVMGVLIIVCILIVYVRCSIVNADVPSATGELLLAATALLGVDSVTSAFKKGD